MQPSEVRVELSGSWTCRCRLGNDPRNSARAVARTCTFAPSVTTSKWVRHITDLLEAGYEGTDRIAGDCGARCRHISLLFEDGLARSGDGGDASHQHHGRAERFDRHRASRANVFCTEQLVRRPCHTVVERHNEHRAYRPGRLHVYG